MTVRELTIEFPQDPHLQTLNPNARVIVDKTGVWWTAELSGRLDKNGKSEVIFTEIGRLVTNG
jgi:hypothetical protein